MSRQYYLLPMIASLLFLFSGNTFAQADTSGLRPDSSGLILKECLGFIDEGKWDSAFYYSKILNEYTKRECGEMSDRYATALYLMGDMYRDTKNYNSAYYYLGKSVDIFTRISPDISINNWQFYGLALSRLGFTCVEMGALDEANIYFTKAMVINERSWNPDYVQMKLFFANRYLSKGEYIKADSMYSALNKFFDSQPQNGFAYYLRGALYNSIAILYTQTGNPQKALSYLQKAVQMESIAKEGYADAGDDYILSLLNLAEAYALTNHLDSALMKCREAEDSLLIKSGAPYYSILKVKAFIYQQQNNLTGAIDLYTQYKKAMDFLLVKPVDYEANMVNLAILYIDTRQPDKADALLKRQIARLHKSGLESSYVMQQAVAALCANLIGMHRYKEATDSLIALCHLTFTVMSKNFEGMSEGEKMQYENDINRIFDLIYVSIDQNKTISKHLLSEIYQLELKRKGLILKSQVNLLSDARNSEDTAFLNVYNNWLGNRQILAKQYSLPYNKRFLNVDSLENYNEMLEKKISAKGFVTVIMSNTPYKNFKASTGLPSSADIEFVRFDYKAGKTDIDSAFYIAFILRSGDSIPALVNLCSEEALLRTMRDDKGEWINENQLTQSIYSGQTEAGNAFYRLVWQPIEEYLEGIKTIDYSTSGLLNNIAFHAIHDGKTYLVDRFDFRRFLSLSDARDKGSAYRKPEAMSIWGNMNYDQASYHNSKMATGTTGPDSAFSVIPTGIKTTAITKTISNEPLPPLPTNEPSRLKKIFGGNNIVTSSFENTRASEENFKQSAAGIKGVLHISTHGFYTPLDKKQTKALLPGNFIAGIENPLFRCGLAFSGVNYYWIKGVAKNNHDDGILTGYEVAQLDLHNVQLVTLSACETGLGDVTDNEANLGLQRAFKLAGVENLLVSLWQVPAKQTAELLSLFYTNWLQGQSLSKALQSAELTMGKKYPPYFWAGFVLIE